MKNQLWILLSVIFLISIASGVSFAWLSGWGYRVPVTVSSSSSLTDYQIKITLDTATLISDGKMNSDCSDIRVTDDSDSALNFWVDSDTCNSASTVIWVKDPSVTDGQTIYVYYGNSGATSASSGDNTFEFFDDFEDGDVSDWLVDNQQDGGYEAVTDTVYDGTYSFRVYGDPSGGAAGVITAYKTISSLSSGVFEAEFYDNGDTAARYGIGIYNSANSFGDEDTIGAGIRTDVDSSNYVVTYYDISSSSIANSDTTISRSNGWHHEKVVFNNGNVDIYIDGTLAKSVTTSSTIDRVHIYADHAYGVNNQYDSRNDDLFIRKYASSEPTTSVGSEETSATISISSISLTPEPIYTDNDASCSATFSDTADSATLYWYVDDTNMTSYAQSCSSCTSISGTLPNSEFSKGQVIKCEINADKGSAHDYDSATITVSNSPPTTPSLSYSPSDVYVGTEITATASDSTDDDGDTITYYYQFTDGSTVLQDWSTTNTYTVPQSEAHATITIHAKAYDGTDYSGETTTDVSVLNTLPTDPTSLDLSPNPIYVDNTLTATASGSTDADGDTITYYYKFYDTTSSTILQDYSTTNTYTIPQSIAHHSIRVYTKAYDGYDYSNEIYSDISISNSAPTDPTVTLSPSPLYVGDTLTASASSSDADGDSITYYYKFYNSTDTLQDWSTTNTYTVPQSQAHGTIYVDVYATDGTDNSGTVTESEAVSNSPPTAPTSMTWNPLSPSINVQETVTASGSTDADGDSITYYYQFYDVNTSTVLQDWSTTNTYTPNSTLENHTLQVNVKAYDGTDYSDVYSESKNVLGKLISIDIHSPANTVYYTDQIPINVTIQSVYDFTASYYIDGTKVLENANESSYFTEELDGGQHVLEVNVTDTEGHTDLANVTFTLNLNIKVQCYDEQTLLPIQCYATVHNDTYEDSQYLEQTFSYYCSSGSDSTTTNTVDMNSNHISFTGVSDTGGSGTASSAGWWLQNDGSVIYSRTWWQENEKITENYEIFIYGSLMYIYLNGVQNDVINIPPYPSLTLRYACSNGASLQINDGIKGGSSASWTNIKGEKYVSAYSNIYVSSTGQTFYYPSRGYYEQSELANASIYLLNSNQVTYASLVVQDLDNVPIADRIIRFEKIINNTEVKLFEGKTDDAGQVTVAVDPNNIYKITDVETNVSRDVRFLSSSPYYFTEGIENITLPEYFQYANGINFSCNVSSDNATITCSVIDENNEISSFKLETYTENYTSMEKNITCTNSTNSDYANLTCNISSNSSYELTAILATGENVLLTSGSVESLAMQGNNTEMLSFLAYMVVIVLLMFSIVSPLLGILGGTLALILFSLLGWISIGGGATIFIVLLAVVVIIKMIW